MFQHDLIVRLFWQLLLYAIPTSTVVKLEQIISKLLRRSLDDTDSWRKQTSEKCAVVKQAEIRNVEM